MNTKLIGRDTQRFIRAFQEIHRIVLEISKARWSEQFPVVLQQAAKKSSVVAAHASELAILHSLRKRIFNVFGTRSAIPSSAAVAKVERIRDSLHRARRRTTARKTKTDDPHSQGMSQKESAKRAISGIDAAVQVLANRNNKQISIVELTAEALTAGWLSKGKSALSNALHNEIRRRGSLARFAKGKRPGMWKLSTVGIHYANERVCMDLITTEPDTGMRMALLMTADDYSVVDEDDLEL